MKKASVSIYLDKLRPKKNGLCAVKIRVTFNRKRKYFPTGIDLTPEEFEKVLFGKRKTPQQKEVFTKLNFFEEKAEKEIKQIKAFSFDAFTEMFLDSRNATDSVSFAFDKYIDELRSENRLGTAESYLCAKNSLEAFKKNVSFADVTPKFLKSYQKCPMM